MTPPAEPDLTLLFTFFDALRASEACRHLEASGIPFQVENRGTPSQGLHDWNDPPTIWLDVSVSPQDLTPARSLLHAAMHLFPDRETPSSAPNKEIEEDIQIEIAFCETEQEAAELSALLTSSDIASRIILPNDPEETLIAIQVSGADAERASLALDRWTK